MSYRPLPDGVTIKRSPIEGLGLYATEDIPENTFIGLTHILDERFENNYLRTPLGGFYNHSNDPTVIRMVSDVLPKLKFGDPVDPHANAKKLKDGKNDRENMFYNLNEKSDAKYRKYLWLLIKGINRSEKNLKAPIKSHTKTVDFSTVRLSSLKKNKLIRKSLKKNAMTRNIKHNKKLM